MNKILLLITFFIISSCFKSDIVQSQTANTDPASMHNGQTFPTKIRSYTNFCAVPKTCKFLFKYDYTYWSDKENYSSDFSSIRFVNLNNNFISFYNTDSDISYCKGWKKGENTYDGKKWNIKIKKDEWDVLWFDYEYYGTSQEIEYTTTYKYEVIDGLLHFSNTEGQKFIFHPSDKNYSRGLIDTAEIIEQEGCLFF